MSNFADTTHLFAKHILHIPFYKPMKTFTHKLVLALTAALLTTAAALAQRTLPGGKPRQAQAVSTQQCRAAVSTKNV